jgi:hypothetical protein
MSYKIVNNKVVKVQRSAFEIARKKAFRKVRRIELHTKHVVFQLPVVDAKQSQIDIIWNE